MLCRADNKRVWEYTGIQVWAIPYILLALENFTGASKNGGTYEFHFIFKKPNGTNISALWDTTHESRICKVFSNKGELVTASDNPYLVSEEAFGKKAGDTSWITSDYLNKLMM